MLHWYAKDNISKQHQNMKINRKIHYRLELRNLGHLHEWVEYNNVQVFESYVIKLPKIDLDMAHFKHAHLLKILAL